MNGSEQRAGIAETCPADTRLFACGIRTAGSRSLAREKLLLLPKKQKVTDAAKYSSVAHSFPGVLHLCSISELSGAPSEYRRILNRQNEVQETLLSLFPIYRRLPKLDAAGSTPVYRSNFSTT